MASEIARACNLPEYYVGGNAAGSMTYSNVTAERRSLIDLSLRPLMTCITQRLSDNDITPRAYDFSIAFCFLLIFISCHLLVVYRTALHLATACEGARESR